ncbi:membrane protein [Streptomyces sp. WM6368]|nr:membrane protein [Streptomyces sp. WM6368]
MGFVFGSRSSKEEKAAATDKVSADLSQPRDPQAPKGRPTPKRAVAQSQRKAVVASTGNRKEDAKRARERRRSEMAKQREALANGDERYLPTRDKGPVRRFVRDYVDSRYSVAEMFLPLAVVILVLSMVRQPAIQSIALMLWLGVIVLIILDSIGLVFRLRKSLNERFPNEPRRGAIAYGLMRTLQMRRLRLPKPQVKRGERP